MTEDPFVRGKPTRWNNPPNSRLLALCRALPLALVFILVAGAAFPSQNESQQPDLSNATIEQLMNMEVTSVSKKKETISRVAAAIYVITQQDILQSGATNIPDLLRMVPGLDVAQINANTWAISSRGFNSEFADKMLVLIDGRTVYDPLFSGVFWNLQDLPLEDIERIEVIRGPGATVWGANAVNGVVNIITKSSKQTQGALLSAGWGTEEGPFTTLQYGGMLGKKGSYRVYGKYFDRNSFVGPSGQHAADGWTSGRGGFRSDWDLSPRDSLMFQGSGYAGSNGDVWRGVTSLAPFAFGAFNDVTDFNGQDILGRWDHALAGGSHTELQMYFERVQLYNTSIALRRNTFDLEFQHHIALGSRHDVVWGLDYRNNSFVTAGSLRVAFNPATLNTSLYGAFVQDEIELLANRVWLTLGSKLEHNYFTGFEVEPSVRLLWQPNDRNTLWAAVSRATRTPSPADDYTHVNFEGFAGPGGLPTLVYAEGNPDFISEDLLAYEIGYRGEISKKVSMDIATYYNVYDNLRGSLPGQPSLVTTGFAPYVLVPLNIVNNLYGRTYGVEASLDLRIIKRWSIHPGYASFAGVLHQIVAPVGIPAIFEGIDDNPKHQFQVRSNLDLPHRLQFDTNVYYVDRLVSQSIPAYTRVDTQLTWHVAESADVSVVGQNLLTARHLEFNGPEDLILPTEIPRSVYGKITWRF
ncbi:MAG: TonB-dependent receptor plug domain-containing protein [Terriglobia bacterium]